jgi:hypothetical protein
MYFISIFEKDKRIINYNTQPLDMKRKIKLIWGFRGLEVVEIAKHHCIHLKEFSDKEKLAYIEISTNKISEIHSIAFIIVNENDMITFRDALKPHRGEVA